MNERTQEVVQHVRALIETNPLFLDTETTGLDGEICEIAVIDLAGNVLINTLIKPTTPIPEDVTSLHGISDEIVQGAPSFKDIFPELERVLRGRTVIVYNANFDKCMILNSARENEMKKQEFDLWWYPENRWYCAMELYAVYYGDWNSYHGSYRWQRLNKAAQQCNIELSDTHRALADAETTRRIVLHIAEQSK